MTNVGLQSDTLTANRSRNRLRHLHGLGTLCGFSAGAWRGAAEAPTKLVSIDVSPIVISFMMVLGVFLARWTVPALLQGTSQVREDMRNTPHLIVWGLLAGCIWAVANTLTIFVIRNIGLSIAFPLWNSNSLLGIFWGFLLFNVPVPWRSHRRRSGNICHGKMPHYGNRAVMASTTITCLPE